MARFWMHEMIMQLANGTRFLGKLQRLQRPAEVPVENPQALLDIDRA